MNVFASLSEMVMCTLNKFETGDSKKASVEEIVKYVEMNYIENIFSKEFKDLTVLEAQKLHKYGAEFLVKNGTVKMIKFEKGRM